MANHEDAVELLARAGFVAKGVIYGIVGVLAATAAIGMGGRITGSEGALLTVMRQPFGRTLLLASAIGLFGYAVWRVLQGVLDTDRRGRDWKAIALRGSFVARGVLHGLIGWQALQLYRGLEGRGRDEKAYASDVAALPLGDWLIVLAGLGLFAFAGYQLYRAATPKLGRHFNAGHAARELGGWAIAVSRAGLAARGVVFSVVAWFMVQAGLARDPNGVADTTDAMRAFSTPPDPFGTILLAFTGAGLAAYGFYQILQARYRDINV
jgi:hypothetical protein